jgi:hypothetical protein
MIDIVRMLRRVWRGGSIEGIGLKGVSLIIQSMDGSWWYLSNARNLEQHSLSCIPFLNSMLRLASDAHVMCKELYFIF